MIAHEGVVRYPHVGGYPPGDMELPRVIEDPVKEKKKGNDRTATPSR